MPVESLELFESPHQGGHKILASIFIPFHGLAFAN
jgi:hypothetical protein